MWRQTYPPVRNTTTSRNKTNVIILLATANIFLESYYTPPRKTPPTFQYTRSWKNNWTALFRLIQQFLNHKCSSLKTRSVMTMERSGSVVECLARDRRAAGRASPARLRCGPWARHIWLLMGRKESNQTKHFYSQKKCQIGIESHLDPHL